MSPDPPTRPSDTTAASTTSPPAPIPRARRIWAAIRPHLPALAFLALMALAYWHRSDSWHIDDDEEGYLYAAWRISRGELPYRDFLTPQLPAFLFPGGLWLALFGPHALVLRTWSAALMLGAGFATYLTGRRLYGPVAGLAAMGVLLLSDDIFPLARAWRPEATMLAFGALALYVFVRADETGQRRGYALAGILFSCSLLAKLFGFLPWAAAAAYLTVDALTRGRSFRRGAGDLAALLVPGLAAAALVMGGFQLLTAETYNAVLEHHLRQGASLAWSEVMAKTLDFYWRALSWHAPLLAFVPLGIYAAWRRAGRRGMVAPWQLPTVLVFLLLTRTLFARHLVYLIPMLGLLFGAALAWLADGLQVGRKARALAVASVLAAVALPFAFDDLERYGREEVGTARLAALVRTLAPAGTRIVADYPGVAFYGGRETTYSAAGLSEGAAESGQITGARLWQEMQAGNVSLVLIDQGTQGGQLKDLVDFAAWRSKVASDYRRLGKLYRHYQPLDVYLRQDQPTLDLDFGSLQAATVQSNRSEVPAGEAVDVTAILVADERPDRAYSAFLHLTGPDDETWAVGDTFMNSALFRGSEEWEVGEVVVIPMTMEVPPGTPPGPYMLRFGLYDAASGARLPWAAPDGASGDAWDMGLLTVLPPRRPPPAPAGRSLGQVGPLALLQASAPESAQAGDPVHVRTTWRASRPPGAALRLRLRLRDEEGATLGESVAAVGGTTWPPARWRTGEVITVPAQVVVAPTAADGAATLEITWLDADGAPLAEAIPVGLVQLAGLGPFSTAVPPIARPVRARLGGTLELLGSSLPGTGPAEAPDARLAFDLYWRADGAVPASYTTLVHVLDPDGNVVAQGDGKPLRPTTSWRPGEVIVDTRTVDLPLDLPPGEYTVLVGLYDASDPTYPRLSAEVDGGVREDGRVEVGMVGVDITK